MKNLNSKIFFASTALICSFSFLPLPTHANGNRAGEAKNKPIVKSSSEKRRTENHARVVSPVSSIEIMTSVVRKSKRSLKTAADNLRKFDLANPTWFDRLVTFPTRNALKKTVDQKIENVKRNSEQLAREILAVREE